MERKKKKKVKYRHTAINISNHYLGALVRKQPCRLGADALPAAGDDGGLAGEQTGGEVEVLIELVETVCGSHNGKMV